MSEMSGALTIPGGRETTKRRWRIPPPLMRDAEAPGPEGLYVLEEFRNELGMVLWKSLRSVILWSQLDAEERDGLFEEKVAEARKSEIRATVPRGDKELREHLEGLLPVLSDPVGADPDAVGAACMGVAAWAEAQGARKSALEFIQAASLACPADPRFALAIGRSARDLTQYARAEAWFYRAVGLSRQVNDWEAYIRAYLAHGKMLLRKGALPAAERSFIKARRRATRQGLRTFEAMSYHELFVLAIAMGSLEQAMTYAERAAKAYGPKHNDFPILAHDVAYYWMQQGDYDRALPVFNEVLGRIREAHRAVILGSIARAAAGTGDRERFEWAVSELEKLQDGPGVAEAWVEVARGAILVGDHDHAVRAAGFAERLARERKEGQVQFMAESVLESAKAEASAVETRRKAAREALDPERQEDFTRKLLRFLRVPAGPGRG